MSIIDSQNREKRHIFFQAVYGDQEGFVCIARIPAAQKGYEEEFFKYPDELDKLLSFIETSVSHNLYFCPNILEQRKRSKEFVKSCPTAYADLDECPPERMHIKPSVIIESSVGRYQALWVMSDDDPATVEDISRRIAYAHVNDGADKSGWDLTQLLRVPFTYNYKYVTPQVVLIKHANSTPIDIADFDLPYPQVEKTDAAKAAMPTEIPEPEDVLQKYRTEFHPRVWNLYQEIPEGDWSKALWQLEMLLYESGCKPEEVFAVARDAKCNKYRRDNRSERLLWREVVRAQSANQSNGHIVLGSNFDSETSLPPLLTSAERNSAESARCIVDDYIDWARSLGDAAWQYHQAGAFVILSTLLSGSVRVPTKYGEIVPNLWFMILADTTLTRKSTAMDIAVELLLDIDDTCVLATDGSIEGLMTSLSVRPNKSSVFLRDEFSGMLDAMARKDYYAGMAETLTKLYDGKFQKRVLRKETIEVRDPILILFTGGIKSRILELMTFEHIASGFIPRFVFIAAESDLDKLEPLGPPSAETLAGRQELQRRFSDLYSYYRQTISVVVDDKKVEMAKRWHATLTPEAWARYNKAEQELLSAGMRSVTKELLTPTLDRLAKTSLKVATLIAACRCEENLVITEADVVKSLWFIEQWSQFSLQVVRNVGKTASEKQLDNIMAAIKRHPGIARGQLMQFFHLNARNTEEILGTLEQRGIMIRQKKGKGETLYPVEV